MDLIALFIIIIVLLFIFKEAKCVVYFIGIVEILLHVLDYIALHIGVAEIANFINKYFPKSILEIIGKYSTGLLYDIFAWIFVLSFLVLDYYLIKYFFKKK